MGEGGGGFLLMWCKPNLCPFQCHKDTLDIIGYFCDTNVHIITLKYNKLLCYQFDQLLAPIFHQKPQNQCDEVIYKTSTNHLLKIQ